MSSRELYAGLLARSQLFHGDISNNNTANHNRPSAQAGLQSYGFAAGPSGGVWVVGRDGGVSAFKEAPFYGSMGGQKLKRPVIGMAATKGRLGYWLVASDGGISVSETSQFFGSTGALKLAQPVVGDGADTVGSGLLVGGIRRGRVLFRRRAVFRVDGRVEVGRTGGGDGADTVGSWLLVGGIRRAACSVSATRSSSARPRRQPVRSPIGGLVSTPTGNGYLIWGQDGSVYPFGDAPAFGGYPSLTPGSVPVVGDDAFVGFDTDITGSGRAARVAGYTLWAVSDVGPPPSVAGIHFQQGG